MYYGYKDKKLIVADQEFIELMGFAFFKELEESKVINNLKYQENKIEIQNNSEIIHADFSQHTMHNREGEFRLIKLKNIEIKETKSSASLEPLKMYQPIYLDVEKIAKEIGLTVSDYKLYLDSFIDQSIIDEKRLMDGNDNVVKNLSNLALTLKIPHINIILLKIQKLSHRERMPLVDEYYTKLALLTLEKPKNYEEDEPSDIFEEANAEAENKEEVLSARFSDLLKNVEQDDEISEDFLLDTDEPIIERPKVDTPSNNPMIHNKIASTSDVKEIDLENITALPISYSPQTAADELNLPVVLIEEFVDDFIEQAHHDKDHLLASYYQKDMDNIHELGHKLKGAASNLRINELSDVLEEIQFCTEHSKLEELFIRYWGYFISLEDYMKKNKA